ncbi:MAG: transposase [archaeon]|nr:transposase [archaeon]
MHDNDFGPQIYSEFQKFSLVILFRRSKKVLRDFIAELYETKWLSWLDFKQMPSKSVLHNWCKKYTVGFIRQLNRTLLQNETPTLMAVDATGVDAYLRSKHYEKRARLEPKFNKLSIFIDVKNHLIYDHVLQMKPRHDVKSAERIFKRTSLREVKILGDKGYDSEPLHEVAQSKQNRLFAPVRESSRNNPKGWNRRRCTKGDEQYNQRSNVETVFTA